MAELVYNHRGIQLYRGDALQELYLWTLAPTPLLLTHSPGPAPLYAPHNN